MHPRRWLIFSCATSCASFRSAGVNASAREKSTGNREHHDQMIRAAISFFLVSPATCALGGRARGEGGAGGGGSGKSKFRYIIVSAVRDSIACHVQASGDVARLAARSRISFTFQVEPLLVLVDALDLTGIAITGAGESGRRLAEACRDLRRSSSTTVAS